jgi:hypothetical protein
VKHISQNQTDSWNFKAFNVNQEKVLLYLH